jgi:hypothetical protein
MIIVQDRWSPSDAAGLERLLRAAQRGQSAGADPTLILLPLSGPVDGLDEAAALGVVGALAATLGVVVAGALRLAAGSVGFVVGADGRALLRSPRIMPDLAEGYSDTPSALDEPAAFAIARLPQGQVAVLVGDVAERILPMLGAFSYASASSAYSSSVVISYTFFILPLVSQGKSQQSQHATLRHSTSPTHLPDNHVRSLRAYPYPCHPRCESHTRQSIRRSSSDYRL